MSKIKMVTYSLGLNVAVHPEIAKSVHFHLFGEFRIPILFDNDTNRLGAARITVKDDIENIEKIARIHSLENHHTFSGEPSKIMESVFFSPTWTPGYLQFLSRTGGWDPDNNPFQFVIDFSKDDSYESFISEISKSCRAIMEGGRVFPETNDYAFISSHVVLIVDDLEEFEEQVLKFRFKGKGVEEDVVRRIEVNFHGHPNNLIIPYIPLGLLPLNCTVFESKPFFDMIENDPTNEHLDIVIPREVLKKVKENRNQIMKSEIYSFLSAEAIILDDCYHTLVQSILDLDIPNISQEDKLQNLIKINKSLDFYQLSISLLKEQEWPKPSEVIIYNPIQDLEKLDQKMSKAVDSLKNRIELEKMQIDYQRTKAENRKTEWFNRWSMYLAFFVLLEVISSFIAWELPQNDILGVFGFSVMIVFSVIVLVYVTVKHR